jgi:hypothetical protein
MIVFHEAVSARDVLALVKPVAAKPQPHGDEWRGIRKLSKNGEMGDPKSEGRDPKVDCENGREEANDAKNRIPLLRLLLLRG